MSPETGSPWTGGHDAAVAVVDKLDSFEFSIPTNLVAWQFTDTHSATVSEKFNIGLTGFSQGSATCTVSVQFIPEGVPQILSTA